MRWLLAAWACVLAPASALTALAAREDRLPGDLWLARRLQDWPLPDAFNDAVRAVTTTQVVLAAGAALAVALWLSGARREALALAVALAVLPLAQAGLKDLVDRPRPSPELVELRAGFTSPSFPAGHVMSPTLLYGYALWLAARHLWPAPLRVVSTLLAASVLATTGAINVHLGVHWPSDVLGGYLWGSVLLLAALALARYGVPTPGVSMPRRAK